MNETFNYVLAVFEHRAVATAERFVAANDALQGITIHHAHYESVKQQSDVTKQAMFDALADYEFIKRTTA
jgi:hypothetical protein